MPDDKKSIMNISNMSVIFENSGGFMKPKTQIGAVIDIDLDIKEGEIIAVVGESGCGKTTIGKTLVGINKPTKGSMTFYGQDATNLKGDDFTHYRLGVQMVHQDSYAALNPARTIFQSLSAPVMRHKIAKSRVEALDQLVGLFEKVGLTPPEHFLFKYPHQLSGGQRQRTLLARALSVKPKLIVADEPVSMVDVSLRISLLDLMSRMNEEMNVAFVYITHDLATARYIAKNGRIVVMYLGKIVETGDLNEVLLNPRHPYLQALLTAIPIPDPKVTRKMTELPLRSLDMPSNVNPPSGCRFHPRCLYCKKICEEQDPQLREYKGERIACHLVEELPEWSWNK